MKMTKTEPADSNMEANQFGATTYGEWCVKEAARIGGGAKVVTEVKKRGRVWCRIEKSV